LLFVRALAFGLAPERFFGPALAATAASFEEAAPAGRSDAPFFASLPAFTAFGFGVPFTAFDAKATFGRPLGPAERLASRALRALIAATRARVARDAPAVLPVSRSVWPGKIIGFRRPLMRIRRSGVVEYFLAIPRIVSPRRTV
jgi:hypothetical protein